MGYTVPPAFVAGISLPAASLTILGNDIVDLDARTQAVTAAVAASETTTSTSFVDLATVGPQVSIVTGTAAMVSVTAEMMNSTGQIIISFAVSGASTVAAGTLQGPYLPPNAASVYTAAGMLFLVTGLTAGTNIFTAKYRVAAGTGNFSSRRLTVWPANKLA